VGCVDPWDVGFDWVGSGWLKIFFWFLVGCVGSTVAKVLKI